ncbi:MAG: NAD(P)H-binding protein [Sandaracinaceae bacterium]
MGGSQTLLTGATGFVGRILYPALVATGHEVRSTARSPSRARADCAGEPERPWVRLDLDEPSTLAPALDGCATAYFLIHGLGEGDDYPEREAKGAEAFLRAAEGAGVERIVYLGGVQPTGPASRHLASRTRTGEILRSGRVTTLELRAAMIMGAGSASWRITVQLARRLPAMLLPRWLESRSWPVLVDDIIVALVAAARLPVDGSTVFEVPGAERLSHRECLERVAKALGSVPTMVRVPVLTPRLSSYWIALVTGVSLAVARELVEGLRSDLDPTGVSIWDRLETAPTGFDEAVRRVLEDERTGPEPAVERIVERLAALPETA